MSESEGIVIPISISFDGLRDILLGYYKSRGHEVALSYSVISAVTGLSRGIISRNYKFLVGAGFLTQEKRGYYKLSELSGSYTRYLDWGREADANLQLKIILKTYKLTELIINYIDIKEGVLRDDLITRIAIFADVTKEGRYITGINAFIDMMLTSNILHNVNDTIYVTKDIEDSILSIEKSYFISEDEKADIELSGLKKNAGEKDIILNINININDKMSADNLKALIKIIKEEFFIE